MNNRKDGLTLIEVILAAALLGILLTGMLVCVSRCVAVLKASYSYHKAVAVMGMGEVEYPLRLDQAIDELEVDPDDGLMEGFVFQREIEEFESEQEEEDALYIVRTKVTWEAHGRKHEHEVVQYLYHPDAKK